MARLSRRGFVLASLGATLAPRAGFAATDYPNKPVRMIVPWAAGGAVDALARIVADGMSREFGQQVVVENKPGANGIIGTEYAAKSTPDGYTMVLVSVEHVLNASVHKTLPFDPIRDFAPVSDFTTQNFALATNTELNVKSVKDVVALAKKNPGKLTFASWGPGSLSQLAGELLKKRAEINMVEVPYKGGPPAITDLLAHRVDMMFTSYSNILAHIKAGKMGVVGVTSEKRADVLPDVPTFQEQGYSDFIIDAWRGLEFPAKTPADIVEKTNKAVRAVLAKPDVRTRLNNLGLEVLGSTPQAFAQRLVEEKERWSKIAHDANIESRS